MKNLILLLCMLLASSSLRAEIYKWTDKNGAVHFSDSNPGKVPAETVKVRINTYTHVTIQTLPDSSTSRRPAGGGRVVLYGTTWCGYCKKARQYFDAHHISYADLDIEKDAGARAQYDSFGGNGVPVIFVGNRRMNGFDASSFDQLYKN